MANQSPSVSQFCFATTETVFGTVNNTAGAATVANSDAVRLAGLQTDPTQPLVSRDVKTGYLTPLVQIPGRPVCSWSMNTELCGNGTAGTKPDIDDFLAAAFGKPSVAVAGTSVTYGIADNLAATPSPSLTIYNFRDPSTVIQQIAVGAVVKTMSLSFNDNGPQKVAFSGPCKYVLENHRFASESTTYKCGLTSFPTRPTTPVFSGSPVLGWNVTGSIGGNSFGTLRSASLSVDFNRELQMDCFNSGLAVAAMQGVRHWPVDLSLYADDSASFIALIAALTGTAQDVVIAVGNVIGNTHTFTLKNILFDRETLDSSARNWSVKIKGAASGVNCDEASYVIT